MTKDGLFQFGNYEFPSTCIAEGGYSSKPNQRQDLDPYTDQTGVTQRNALQHTKTEVSITTRENLTWNEFKAIMQGITSNYKIWSERDAQCTYFDQETCTFKTGHLYLQSSQDFQIKTYRQRVPSMTLVFVEY